MKFVTKVVLLFLSVMLISSAFMFGVFRWLTQKSLLRKVETTDHYKRVLDPSYIGLNLTANTDLDPKECRPQSKIAFAKLHKTASSTIQNILVRYALGSGLNLVLPRAGFTFFLRQQRFDAGDDSAFPRWHRKLRESRGYDVFASHALFDIEEIRLLLGVEATFITTLRDPIDQYLSGFSYYKLSKNVFGGRTLPAVIQSLRQNKSGLAPPRHAGIGFNQQTFDLNLVADLDLTSPQDAASVTVQVLQEEFSLVMISERMEESLVLLAHALCWPLYRVVGFKKNARPDGDEKSSLTPDEIAVLSKYQEADILLYDHFSRVLQRRIDQFGVENMRRAVLELRSLNEQVSKACDAQAVSGKEKDLWKTLIRTHRDVVVYKVREDLFECQWLAYSEWGLMEVAREMQNKRHNVTES